MNILLWILLGGLIGWIASKALHKQTTEIRSVYVLLGCIGSVLAAIVANQFITNAVTGFDLTLLILALVGSVVLIGLGVTFINHTDDKHLSEHPK